MKMEENDKMYIKMLSQLEHMLSSSKHKRKRNMVGKCNILKTETHDA